MSKLAIKIISIPSGAIKSQMFISVSTVFFVISIPSGAIKSQQSFFHRLRKLNFNSFWCD